MLILDTGAMNGVACSGRSALVFLGVSVIVIITLSLEFLRRYLSSSMSRRLGTGSSASPVTDRQTGAIGRTALISIAIIVAVAILVLAGTVAMARHRSLLFVEGPYIIETGCRWGAPYETRFDRSQVQIKLKTQRYRQYGSNGILISQKGKGRTLEIPLPPRGDLATLIAFAPQPMAAYSRLLEGRDDALAQEIKSMMPISGKP